MNRNLGEIGVSWEVYARHTQEICSTTIIDPCKNDGNNDLWDINEQQETKDPFRSSPYCIHPQDHDYCNQNCSQCELKHAKE